MSTSAAKCLLCKKNPVYGKRQIVCASCLLMQHLKELKIPFAREWQFHPERRWHFDFFAGHLGARKIAIEIEGGIWTNGRHTRGAGFEKDIRKYNEAAKLGWTVIRFTPNMIERAEDKVFLAELFGRKL